MIRFVLMEQSVPPIPSEAVGSREVERPIEPNEGQSGADILLSMFKSTNAGRSSFPVREHFCPESNSSSAIQHFLINETLHDVDSSEK